jgi:hypothetical protein
MTSHLKNCRNALYLFNAVEAERVSIIHAWKSSTCDRRTAVGDQHVDCRRHGGVDRLSSIWAANSSTAKRRFGHRRQCRCRPPNYPARWWSVAVIARVNGLVVVAVVPEVEVDPATMSPCRGPEPAERVVTR